MQPNSAYHGSLLAASPMVHFDILDSNQVTACSVYQADTEEVTACGVYQADTEEFQVTMDVIALHALLVTICMSEHAFQHEQQRCLCWRSSSAHESADRLQALR